MALTGPDGLLKAVTKTVIETALDEELSEHLGYDKHAPEGRGSGNSRNGTRPKTVLTDACGAVEIEVPRDGVGSFQPQIVKKRRRRLSDVDEVVLSLYARGLTTGEISANFADIYGAQVSKDTVSRIADRVVEDTTGWHTRPLERVYAAVFIDVLHVKTIKPIHTAVNAAAAKEALDAFDAEWGQRYPAAIRLWRNAWEEFIPFLDYDTEIRKVICSTNAIVIWSSFGSVFDVRHGAWGSAVLRGGRGYLQSSRRKSLEGQCRLYGWFHQSRRVSRGLSSAMTMRRLLRWSGIWRI